LPDYRLVLFFGRTEYYKTATGVVIRRDFAITLSYMEMRGHQRFLVGRHFLILTFVLSIEVHALLGADIMGAIQVTPRPSSAPVMISPYARNRYRPPKPAATLQGGLDESIIVYLDEHPALQSSPPAGPSPVIDQRQLTIVPHVTPIVVGTTVEFLNSDNVYHNIFSLSRTRRFNLGRYPKGQRRSVTFDRTGVVEIFCDIHSEMNGVILVLPNPYFTRVNPDGSYHLRDVPEGTFVVKVWREKSGGLIETATVIDINDVGVVNFEL
jgi:plastocyanin